MAENELPVAVIERSRVFVRDIEPDPGYEFRVIDPGEEVAIEAGTWVELVPADELEGVVEALEQIAEYHEHGRHSAVTPANLAGIARRAIARLGGSSRMAARWTVKACPECGAGEYDPPTGCAHCERGGHLVEVEVVPASRFVSGLAGAVEALTEAERTWTLARVLVNGRPRSDWQIGTPDEWPENAAIEAVEVAPVEQLRGAVEASRDLAEAVAIGCGSRLTARDVALADRAQRVLDRLGGSSRMDLLAHTWTIRNVDGGPLTVRQDNDTEPWLTVGESVEVVPAEQLRGAVPITTTDREWLRKAAAILNGEEVSPTMRKKAAGELERLAYRADRAGGQ